MEHQADLYVFFGHYTSLGTSSGAKVLNGFVVDVRCLTPTALSIGCILEGMPVYILSKRPLMRQLLQLAMQWSTIELCANCLVNSGPDVDPWN